MTREILNRKWIVYPTDGSGALKPDYSDVIVSNGGERVNLEKVNLFLDLQGYCNNGWDNGQVARAIKENLQTEKLKERVNPFELIFKNGVPMRLMENGDLEEMDVDNETELGRVEVEGMQNIRELALRGYKTIAWFSPNGGNSPYEEIRMVVAKLKEIGEDDTIVFECRGICGKYDRLDFYKRVLNIINDDNFVDGEINNPDDLRNHPVGLNLKDEEWFEYFPAFFGELSEVFEAIAAGEDIRSVLEAEKIALELHREFGSRIARIENKFEAVVLGNLMEDYLSRMHGMNLKAGGGNHGMSNKDAFNSLYGSSMVVTKDTEGAKWCSDCKVYYLGNKCPLCTK
ncbi:MAG: hypothetical protein Q8P53_00955 [Candidatus Shapirobacteria bacterium]|nr:hypothetical protein [Candidatus Shapirobacteria bacterium]